MVSPTRLAVVVLGLAAVVYGTASLTGGWLGTPPWWKDSRYETLVEAVHRLDDVAAEARARHDERIRAGRALVDQLQAEREGHRVLLSSPAPTPPRHSESPAYPLAFPRASEGREWISGGVVAAGLALAALSAWPRRRPMAAMSLPTDRG